MSYEEEYFDIFDSPAFNVISVVDIQYYIIQMWSKPSTHSHRKLLNVHLKICPYYMLAHK